MKALPFSPRAMRDEILKLLATARPSTATGRSSDFPA